MQDAGGARTAVVALDVGGTTVKGALVGGDGAVLARRTVPTPAADGGDAVMRAVVGLARDLAAGTPLPVVAAGAVSPGRVDARAGIVRYAGNLGWRDAPLRDALAAELRVPVAVDNDACAAGLAEARLLTPVGDPPEAPDCFFVSLGTGVGGALIHDGKVRTGASGAAGEIGHVSVVPGGEPCPCGQLGCLEVYASAAAIARGYTARSGVPVTGARDVMARLADDGTARAVWDRALDALATALAIATLVIDPGTIVLGGGLAGAGALLTDPVADRLATRLTWRPAPPVELSVLGMDAGWRGASLRAWELVRPSAAPIAMEAVR